MLKSTKKRNTNRRALQKISIDKNTQINIISNLNKQNNLSFGKFDSGMNSIFNYFESKNKKVTKLYKKQKGINSIKNKTLSPKEKIINNINKNFKNKNVNEYINEIFNYYLYLINNTKT